ncbi:hypothetical protein GGR55DRAFT_299346 [Xylaria sp. FL0064]|nr:hypothetical protein GGR55DRAFT_299346 [Xylaria sp. FL0064]
MAGKEHLRPYFFFPAIKAGLLTFPTLIYANHPRVLVELSCSIGIMIPFVRLLLLFLFCVWEPC